MLSLQDGSGNCSQTLITLDAGKHGKITLAYQEKDMEEISKLFHLIAFNAEEVDEILDDMRRLVKRGQYKGCGKGEMGSWWDFDIMGRVVLVCRANHVEG